MTKNSKSVTVSYGIFSCTLEGYDDPLEMVKALTEHFRDLADENRHFGTEPAQLGAEFTAKAERREASRPIETHRHNGTVIPPLHGDDKKGTATNAEAFFANSISAPPLDDDVKLERFGPELRDNFNAEPESIEPILADATDIDSIAKKLQRIRDVVSQHDAEALDEYVEDDVALTTKSNSTSGVAQIDQHEESPETVQSSITAKSGNMTDERQPARSELSGSHDHPRDDFSRLLAEADHQMDEPEGATRRDAFSHLRAAVAARFAEDVIDDAPSEEETTKAYRSDLAKAVKPLRPKTLGKTARRPAPLKLVAEQRVDSPMRLEKANLKPRHRADTANDGPIEPGKIAFPEYAEEMGATRLPELLEAAAAYLSFVEACKAFSRPQLMMCARQTKPGDFSGEEGIRAFGQLLRSGKIEKDEDGLFMASDTIGFQPDERAAG